MILAKKALLFGLVLAALAGLIVSRPALAHDAASDKQMGVILHIEPYDYPVTNEPQTLVFYYNDLNRKFNTASCMCRAVATKTGKTYLNKLVLPTSDQVGKTTFTFLETGIYKLALSGRPQPATAFTPFDVSFNIEVHKNAAAKTPRGGTAIILGLFVAGFLILIASLYHLAKKGR